MNKQRRVYDRKNNIKSFFFARHACNKNIKTLDSSHTKKCPDVIPV